MKQRILVVGCSGSGKSTFSRRLNQRNGLPLVHLDHLYWQPGWRPTPKASWRETVAQLVNEPQWILDGHYRSTLGMRATRADMIIVLDASRWRCLRGIVRRRLRRAQAIPGCSDRISGDFLKYVWQYRAKYRADDLATIARHAPHVPMVMLRSRKAETEFLESLD